MMEENEKLRLRINTLEEKVFEMEAEIGKSNITSSELQKNVFELEEKIRL